MARIPPVKMSYPCNECSFEAQSARQLSRHKAVTHVENALKCVLCPFVTAYQTNLLRHRREVHGICGSKGNKSCKFCGFLSEDNETLIRHQLEVHRDILKSAQVKFAKELVSAGGEESVCSSSSLAKYEQRLDFLQSQQKAKKSQEVNENNISQGLDNEEEEYDDKNFWKEGFEDDGPNIYMNLASLQQSAREQSEAVNHWYASSGQTSPSVDNSISDFIASGTHKKMKKKMPIPASAGSNDELPATRIRRQYTCNDCGFRTINPREFLYHRRDAHGQRLKIVECPYCVYACQYVQKLQRHLLLVHKLETSMTPPPELSSHSSGKSKSKAVPQNKAMVKSEPQDVSNDTIGDLQLNVVPKIRVKLPTLTSPAMVATADVNHPIPPPPKPKLVSHKSITDQKKKFALQRQISANQKRMNDKSIFAKKYHKCQTCGYMTNVQYLFKKHMKYHSAPKIKCEMCDFESPYSWNVDRHVRSHYTNGLFKCTKCSFACDKKQALTVHMTQHHRDRSGTGADQQSQLSIDANQNNTFAEENVSQEMNVNDGEDVEEEMNPLAHLFTQTLEEEPQMGIPSQGSRGTTTYVRQMDGKIVAKQGVVKKCKYCTFQTDTFPKLQKHETTFHPEKKFQCPLCEIKFENLVWLQRHLTHMHQEDSQANNIVNILEQLNPKRKRNKPMPSTSTPLSQSTEALVESLSVNLKRKQVMNDKSATQCQVCGYQTRWISELEKHMRVHTKERPFACPYCSFKSKWKGDLNRHIQKYHSRLPMPDLNLMEQQIQSQSDGPSMGESSAEWTPQSISQDMNSGIEGDYENDTSILSGEVEFEDYNDDIEDIKMDDKPLPDDYEERPLVFDDLSDEDNTGADMGDEDNENELQIDFEEREVATPTENASTSDSPNEMTKSGKVKMYRCSYCDFTCSTASRFHVHFVQHLNTKPFQCSVCGHRSNWEWDVTKHIKMKSQRDVKHQNAKAMLVHESGKRDYSKYNKYVVWVNQKDAIANNNTNPKIDFRAKRARLEPIDGVEYDDQSNDNNPSNEGDYEDDFVGDPESIVITPDICFEVQGEDESTNANMQYSQGFNPSLQPNVPYNSNTDDARLQCFYCDFKHKESKSMIGHLGTHAGMKPYRCRVCHFDSNWKEVVQRHCMKIHQSGSEDVEQVFRCTVNRSICKIVDDSNIVSKGMVPSVPNLTNLPSAVKAFQESHQSVRISGFKGSFVCDLCPFRAEKAFHMDFHVKRHQPSSGPFKCPHCPYWVNAKKSLVKHMLLHVDSDTEHRGQRNANGTGMRGDVNEDNDSENGLVIYEGEDNQYFPQQSSNTPTRQSASVCKNRCDKCPFIAGTKTQLLYHKQFHRPNRNSTYSCTLCTYSVNYLHLLNQHMKVHYQASGDNQEPINYYDLPQDEDELEEDDDDRDETDIPFTWVQIGNNRRKLFQCRFCSTTSKRRTYIYVHEKLHTQSNSETFRCSQSQCSFETRDANHYLSHISGHKDDTNSDKQQMQTNQNETHFTAPSVSVIDVNNIRHGSRRMFSYVCPDCPAAFKSPGDLKIHSAFHGAEHPHPCPYCNYRAKNKPQLCKHLYVHTAEYIAKRANSYPDGTKLLIGDAVDQMKRDMKCMSKDSNAFHSQSTATSLLKKSDTNSKDMSPQSPPWAEIARQVNDGKLPKRAALFSNRSQTPIQQMILLEMSESNTYLDKIRTGVKHRFIYRCSHCPAVFMKVNTLTFHVRMHGSESANKCNLCSYSTTSSDNLMVHKQLHNYQSYASATNSVYNHRCDRCPAAFSKKSRLEKHITLHGSDAKWRCDQCDYAVQFAATLVKHRACHQMNPNFNTLSLENTDNQLESSEVQNKGSENIGNDSDNKSKTVLTENSVSNVEEKDEKPEKKVLYCCDRCPYVHIQKDAVESHLKRHEEHIQDIRERKQCPYCDYTCPQPSYLREHIQWHFDPPLDRKPELFTYFDNLEVYRMETLDSDDIQPKEDKQSEVETKQLLFKDLGVKYIMRQRFEPNESDEDFFEFFDTNANRYSDSDSDEDKPPALNSSDDIELF